MAGSVGSAGQETAELDRIRHEGQADRQGRKTRAGQDREERQAGQGRQGRAGSADMKARQAEQFWNCRQTGKGRAIRLGRQVLAG